MQGYPPKRVQYLEACYGDSLAKKETGGFMDAIQFTACHSKKSRIVNRSQKIQLSLPAPCLHPNLKSP